MEETVYLAPDICHLSVGFLAVSRFTVMCGCVGRKSLLESFLKRSTLCGIWMPWGGKGWLAHCFIQLSLLYALRRPVHHKTTASLQLGFISFKVGFTVRTKGQDLSSYFQCWLDIFLSIAFRKRAREYFFFFLCWIFEILLSAAWRSGHNKGAMQDLQRTPGLKWLPCQLPSPTKTFAHSNCAYDRAWHFVEHLWVLKAIV